MNDRKIVPYSADHIRARRAGLVTAWGELVVMVDHWSTFANRERVVMPPGESPDDFQWDFLRGLGVLVVWSSNRCQATRGFNPLTTSGIDPLG